MPEFLELIPPTDALDRLLNNLPQPIPSTESVATADAVGRVLRMDITASDPLPPFPRSTVDGYALRASDSYGAAPSLPAYLELVGEVAMGQSTDINLQSGQVALVHTGGMLPSSADAVVMLEDTQDIGSGEIEVHKAVAPGENVLQCGEDVQIGDVVLRAGSRLRPQEIGGLMALGYSKVQVAQRPRVSILSTGDEVVPPDQQPGPGQVRDVNSYALGALVQRAGGVPILRGIIPDRYETLLKAVKKAHAEDDLVVITAGSSVSARDITADVIAELGQPGVLVHGVSIKPGKPTILAIADGVPVIGLPGNPVSALVIAGLFVSPLVRRLSGLLEDPFQPTVRATLSINLASLAGREDYIPVELAASPDGIIAEPVFGRSNLIFTLVRAQGMIRIPPEATGLGAGTPVEVHLF